MILTYSSLSQVGINPLTGEACAYSMRILCDLNEDGVALIADFFGIPRYPLPALAGQWNSMVGDKPAVASVMLPRELFPALMKFALLRAGYQYVIESSGGRQFAGYAADDKYLQSYLDWPPEEWIACGMRLHRNPANPFASDGSRNVHQMTGRTL